MATRSKPKVPKETLRCPTGNSGPKSLLTPTVEGERHSFDCERICAYSPEPGVWKRWSRECGAGAYQPFGCGSAAAIRAIIWRSSTSCTDRCDSARNWVSSTSTITPKNSASGTDTESSSRRLSECTYEV